MEYLGEIKDHLFPIDERGQRETSSVPLTGALSGSQSNIDLIKQNYSSAPRDGIFLLTKFEKKFLHAKTIFVLSVSEKDSISC